MRILSLNQMLQLALMRCQIWLARGWHAEVDESDQVAMFLQLF